MRVVTLALAAAALAACAQPLPEGVDAERQASLKQGQVALVATAPDGTKLWAVKAGRRYVYFSSAGTQTSRTTQSGKQRATVMVQVPNAPAPQER